MTVNQKKFDSQAAEKKATIFLVVFNIAACLLLAACQKSPPTEKPTVSEPVVREATIPEQERCRDDAEKFYSKVQNASVYTHFDTVRNACYGLAVFVVVAPKTLTYAADANDVLSGQKLGQFLSSVQKPEAITCWVRPPSGESYSCKTTQEFDELVEKHLGIRQ